MLNGITSAALDLGERVGTNMHLLYTVSQKNPTFDLL